ncbi:MAG: Crp/Fnr family transcriptional regulator [Bacilli bacterium]|jgi:CRP/FNR family transcriptional regulator|nr:Crp/Fnr family transcriptional regulator [Acholeplasmataceae bacterium]
MTVENINILNEYLTIFPELSSRDQKQIIDGSSFHKYKKGEQIYNVTRTCNGIMIVKSGQLRTYMLSDEGKEITLYRLLPGDVCVMTSSCLFNNLDIEIHILVEKPTEVIIIPYQILDSMRKENSMVDRFLLDIISQRFSEVMWVMEQVVFSPMLKRVAECLVNHWSLADSDVVRITHGEIANDLGTAREVVTRLLDYLQNDNVIKQERGKITILDPLKLQTLYK